MSEPNNSMPAQFPGGQGTGMVDRINVAIHLRRYLKLIGRRWFLLLFCVAVSTGSYAYRAKNEPNVYSAYSTIGFKYQVQTDGRPNVQVIDPAMDNYAENQLQIMQSSAVIGKVEERMRDYQTSNPLRPSADRRAGKGAGSTFQLSVESLEFDYARLYVSNWARAFVAYKIEQRDQAIERTTASTRMDLRRHEQDLERIRTRILDFKKKNGVSNMQEAGLAAQQQLEKLKAEKENYRTMRMRLESYTKEQLADSVVETARKEGEKPAGKNAPANDGGTVRVTDPLSLFKDNNYPQLKIELKTKEAEYASALTSLKPKHPFMVQLANQVAKLKQDMKFQLENIEDRRKAEIEQLKKDEASLEPLIAQKQREVDDKQGILHEFESLQSEEDTVKKQVESARVALTSLESAPTNEETFNILDEGLGSSAPIRPDRRKMVLTGLMIGFAVGLGLIFLLHRLDDRLELAEDVEEQLEEPVLGQVPQIDKSMATGGCVLVTRLDQHNMFAESIRGVRSAVLFGAQGASRKVMLVSSAVPGDGKTTFTVNFAATLANAGQRVLLVDADLRRGNTHKYFEHPREPGLTEVLMGELHWEDVVQHTEVKTLDVINSGKLPANPGELLISPLTRQFVEEARQQYDHILFDCPPLTAIDDTFCLLGLSDGLLFVVKAGQTSMRFAKNALSAVRHRGAQIIGVVLNGITGDNPYYYYNYYYHAYYNSSQKSVTPASPSQPGVKMAARRRTRLPSIEGAAHARAGQPISSAQIAAEEQRKAEEFKARRAQRHSASADKAQGTATTKPNDVKPE